MQEELKQRARDIIERLSKLDSSKRPGGGVHGQVIGMEPYIIRTNGDGLQCLYDAQLLINELVDPWNRRTPVSGEVAEGGITVERKGESFVIKGLKPQFTYVLTERDERHDEDETPPILAAIVAPSSAQGIDHAKLRHDAYEEWLRDPGSEMLAEDGWSTRNIWNAGWQARGQQAGVPEVGHAALTEFIEKVCLGDTRLIANAENAFYWFNKCLAAAAAPGEAG